MSTFHDPVMLRQTLDLLHIRSGGIYVDATLGGGGHSKGILSECPSIRLYGFDRDQEALGEASVVLKQWQDRITLIHENFMKMRFILALQQIKSVDGILFDLGISSHQIDDASRGFSFESDAPLDMRMDSRLAYNAWNVVNESNERQLELIFRQYGEERNSRQIARAIIQERISNGINTTLQLAAIIEKTVRGNPKEVTKCKARIFQSIRIHLNGELDALQTALRDGINILNPGGRIVVISYHSLEDRMVKQEFRNASGICHCPPKSPKCICANKTKIKIMTLRPIEADETEVKHNSRARSAKLRAAERVMGES